MTFEKRAPAQQKDTKLKPVEARVKRTQIPPREKKRTKSTIVNSSTDLYYVLLIIGDHLIQAWLCSVSCAMRKVKHYSKKETYSYNI